MHAVKNGGQPGEIPLVHSTCLQKGAVDFMQFRASNATFRLSGPVVLLTRVGEPQKHKLVLYKGNKTFAISDCVFAFKSKLAELHRLYAILLQSWNSLATLYQGTGAKYLTVADIAMLLRSHGFSVRAGSQVAAAQLNRAITYGLERADTELHRRMAQQLWKNNDRAD